MATLFPFQRRPSTTRVTMVWLVLSLLIHAIVVPLFVLFLLIAPDAWESPKKDEMEVSVVVEEVEPAVAEILELAESQLMPVPELPPEEIWEEEEEEDDQEEEPPVELENDDRKPVEQVTNEERPEEADYVSPEDNLVEEETRALDSQLADAEPADETVHEETFEPEEFVQDYEEARSSDPIPDETHETSVPQETGEFGRESPTISDPRDLFRTPVEDVERVFGPADDVEVEQPQGRKLLADWEKREEQMRASLENFIQEVRPGNHTGVNAHRRVYAGYIAMIHRKIHPLWAEGYLAQLDYRAPRSSPLHNPNLNTTLEFVIRADNGEVEQVNIVRSSGQMMFDAEAVQIGWRIGPHPNPPAAIISPNGRVYIHWNFWRDQRQCGAFGASVFIVDTDAG